MTITQDEINTAVKLMNNKKSGKLGEKVPELMK